MSEHQSLFLLVGFVIGIFFALGMVDIALHRRKFREQNLRASIDRKIAEDLEVELDQNVQRHIRSLEARP